MNNNYKEGEISTNDKFSPSYINIKNPKYIEIDGIYYIGMIIVDYIREHSELLFKNIIELNENINISVFYEKQDTFKVIKDLTFNIGNIGVDLEKIGKARQDADIAAFTYNDAKFIRKEMQINNEEMYYIYTYLTVYSDNLKELEYKYSKIEGILRSQGLIVKNAYFRQDNVFKACMPLLENNIDIKNVARRNILTNSIVATYPFISSTIFDEMGIFIGTNLYNDSLVFIDKYNREKYKNSNMCILGTSGSGKSFFTKLMIFRNHLFKLNQYIIDPDREYTNLAKELNGTIIKLGPSSNTYINVFDIREESLEEEQENYLATKISKLIGFFYLIMGDMKDYEKAILEEKIIEVYNDKEITFDDSSLFNNNEFKKEKDMPIMEDLYNKLDGEMKIKLKPFINGSLKYFNNYTNVKLDNQLIIGDIYDLGEENIKYGMYIFIELFWDKIKNNRNIKKSIYMDEIWQLIGVTSNKDVASFIYKIFKTIRKYGGSAVAITQDVSDLFSLEDGIYGKSIINNSELKAFFNLEEENLIVLDKYLNLTEKEKVEIKGLKRGECVLFVGKEHILVKVEAADFEEKIINEKNNNSNR